MTRSVNPRTGEEFGPTFEDAAPEIIEKDIARAAMAYRTWSVTPAEIRAKCLEAIADGLDAQSENLVAIADLETGLGETRLSGEVGRTTFQLRSFANALRSGMQIDAQIDAAVSAPLPQGHPRFEKKFLGIGVVAVFGASNFPFAFSVMGGDSAAALAAGCALVIKAHPAHPQTSQSVFDIASQALHSCGAPAGLISLGHGVAYGRDAITHPLVSAGAFTGSRRGGRALFDLASSRDYPIPFYGELGSVNPVVVLDSALADPQAMAGAYLDSLLLGNGQFCTNPSVLFIPDNSEFFGAVESQLAIRDPQPFLSKATKDLHDLNRAALSRDLPGRVLSGKDAPATGFFSQAQVFVSSLVEIATVDVLFNECFGPTGIILTYSTLDQVLDAVASLEGALVGSLFARELDSEAQRVATALSGKVGRVALNAWPTGVAVTPGQHHGGPYPAATSPLHTSVGIQAITRFLRPVTFQGFPEGVL